MTSPHPVKFAGHQVKGALPGCRNEALAAASFATTAATADEPFANHWLRDPRCRMDGSRHRFNQRRGIGIARKWAHADKPAVLHFSLEGAPVRMIWDKSCRTIHQHMSGEHRSVDSTRRKPTISHGCVPWNCLRGIAQFLSRSWSARIRQNGPFALPWIGRRSLGFRRAAQWFQSKRRRELRARLAVKCSTYDTAISPRRAYWPSLLAAGGSSTLYETFR